MSADKQKEENTTQIFNVIILYSHVCVGICVCICLCIYLTFVWQRNKYSYVCPYNCVQ